MCFFKCDARENAFPHESHLPIATDNLKEIKLMGYKSQSQFCTLKTSSADVHLKTITKQLKGKLCPDSTELCVVITK